MLSCLALPRFTCRFYVLIFLLFLGIPWSNVEFFSSGYDFIQSQAVLPPRRPVQIKNIARSQRRSYRRHTKFKSPNQRIIHQDIDPFGGWASLPILLPHITPLLPCFPNPPEVSVTRTQVFNIMWAEAYWGRVVQEFLTTHDPSRLVDIYRLFSPSHNEEGVIQVPINKALISSIEDPYCLSSQFVQAGVIIDSGASVCISPH